MGTFINESREALNREIRMYQSYIDKDKAMLAKLDELRLIPANSDPEGVGALTLGTTTLTVWAAEGVSANDLSRSIAALFGETIRRKSFMEGTGKMEYHISLPDTALTAITVVGQPPATCTLKKVVTGTKEVFHYEITCE